MRVIIEPNVHILAMPIFFPHPEYDLPEIPQENARRDRDEEEGKYYEHYPQFDVLRITAHAGKGCYDSYGRDGRSIEDHIRNLRNTRHGSVFEHINITLFLTGISRGLSHEFVRHRHFAISQRSTRYTAEEGAGIVLDPYYSALWKRFSPKLTETELWKDDPMVLDQQEGPQRTDYNILHSFLESCAQSIRAYGITVGNLIKVAPESKNKTEKRKWARGKARQLLPHALETRITVTANIRAWRWFLEVRSEASAEPEIRRLAHAIFHEMYVMCPLFLEDFEFRYPENDDIPELVPQYSKI